MNKTWIIVVLLIAAGLIGYVYLQGQPGGGTAATGGAGGQTAPSAGSPTAATPTAPAPAATAPAATATAPAAGATTGGSTSGGAMADVLTPEGFDANKIVEMIDASTMDPVKKATLKTLVEQAASNPEQVQAVIDKVKAALGQ